MIQSHKSVFAAFSFFTVLLVSTGAFAKASGQIEIDNSRVKSEGIVRISISGGKHSAAARLYASLTLVKEEGDNAMGGRQGSTKQAEGVSCTVENDIYAHDAYTCDIQLTTAGLSLDPTK